MKFKKLILYFIFLEVISFSAFSASYLVYFDEIKNAFKGVTFSEEIINISCEIFPNLEEDECNLNKVYVFYIKNNELFAEELEYLSIYRNGNREYNLSKYLQYSFHFVAIAREIIYYNETSHLFLYYGFRKNTTIIINTELQETSFLIKKLEPGDRIILLDKNITYYRERIKEEPSFLKPIINISYKNLDDVVGYGVNIFLTIMNQNLSNTYTVTLRCISQNIECNEIKDTFNVNPHQTKTRTYLIVPKLIEKNITYSPQTLSDKILFFLLKDSIKNYKNYENIKIEILVESTNFSERRFIETDYFLAYYRPVMYYNYLVLSLMILFVFLIIDSFIRYKKYQKGVENE